MRSRIALAAVGVTALGTLAIGQQKPGTHLNPMIDLHIQKKPIFGLYAPSNPRGRGNRGGAAAAAPANPNAANQTTPPAPPKDDRGSLQRQLDNITNAPQKPGGN